MRARSYKLTGLFWYAPLAADRAERVPWDSGTC